MIIVESPVHVPRQPDMRIEQQFQWSESSNQTPDHNASHLTSRFGLLPTFQLSEVNAGFLCFENAAGQRHLLRATACIRERHALIVIPNRLGIVKHPRALLLQSIAKLNILEATT